MNQEDNKNPLCEPGSSSGPYYRKVLEFSASLTRKRVYRNNATDYGGGNTTDLAHGEDTSV